MPEAYASLVAKFRAWDAHMLPLDPAASTWGFSGKDAADHFGVKANRTSRYPAPPRPRPPDATSTAPSKQPVGEVGE